eukprot:966440-Rhodomonas_salina.2
MSCTDIAYDAICLAACYAMPGTDLACGAICPCGCYAMRDADIAYGATRPIQSWAQRGSLVPVLRSPFPMVLRTCYSMSSTDIGSISVVLRTRYAMSGTDVGHAATRTFGVLT